MQEKTRGTIFGVAFMVGSAAIDYFQGHALDPVKSIVGGLVAGFVYYLILRWRSKSI